MTNIYGRLNSYYYLAICCRAVQIVKVGNLVAAERSEAALVNPQPQARTPGVENSVGYSYSVACGGSEWMSS